MATSMPVQLPGHEERREGGAESLTKQAMWKSERESETDREREKVKMRDSRRDE